MIKLPEEILNGISEEKILYNEPMSRHTASKTGGCASVLLLPDTIDELLLIYSSLRGVKQLALIGEGANSLFADSGFNGIVVKMGGIRKIEKIGKYISATAGFPMRELSQTALEYGLGGIEWTIADSGSLGAAIAYNASHYGAEMADSLYAIELLTNKGEVLTLRPDMCNMHKRKTDIVMNKHIVLRAMLNLKKENREAIRQCMLRHERLEGLSEALKANGQKNGGVKISGVTGAVFRGPVYVDHLGELIKSCGLLGISFGDAYLSRKNPLRIINKGEARASDIKCIIEKVIMTVLEKKGIQIFPEITMFGKV